jgi:flagellar basal-body rod modification protein FlgD
MANTLNVNGSTAASGQDTKTALTPGGKELDKSTFLKLLVAQIKNQNPLNPADGLEFVSQLTQFSQLEQMMAIRQDVDGLAGAGDASQENTGTA